MTTAIELGDEPLTTQVWEWDGEDGTPRVPRRCSGASVGNDLSRNERWFRLGTGLASKVIESHQLANKTRQTPAAHSLVGTEGTEGDLVVPPNAG